MKIRIPRTKREIELHAAMRKSERRKRQQVKGKEDIGMDLSWWQAHRVCAYRGSWTTNTIDRHEDNANTKFAEWHRHGHHQTGRRRRRVDRETAGSNGVRARYVHA